MTAPHFLLRNNHLLLPMLVSYLLFGVLHELSHLAVASALIPSFHPFASLHDILHFAARALLGRYCLIELNDDAPSSTALIIRHVGWIFSLAMAVGLHYYYHCHRARSNTSSTPSENKLLASSWTFYWPIVILAAYVTALEAITTDLLGFVPIFYQVRII